MVDSIPTDLKDLIKILEDDSELLEKKTVAISQLGTILSKDISEGDYQQGVHTLIQQVQFQDNCKVIIQCLGVLGRIRSKEAVMTLIDVVLAHRIALYESNPKPNQNYKETDESLRVRSAAVLALGQIKDERAIIPLMSLLNNKQENYRLRLTVAESLGKLGDPHALRPLLDILSDEREKSLYLKESAVKALGMLGDIRALETLIQVWESKRGFRDKFDFLKEQLVEAMGRIGSQDHKNRKLIESLVQALKDEAPSLRLAAVQALIEVSDENDSEIIGHLTTLVFDKDDDVAMAAISGIYTLGGESAVRDLLSLENLPRFLRDEIESYIP